MTFYTYDPKGYRIPYDPVSDWRKPVRGAVEGLRVFDQEPGPDWTYAKPPKDKQKDQKVAPKKAQPAPEIEESSVETAAKLDDQDFGGKRGFEPLRDLTAKDLMRRDVITLHPWNTFEEAWVVFMKNQFHQIPIVISTNHIVGILSSRQLMIQIITLSQEDPDKLMNRLVGDVMTTPVLTAEEEVSLPEAASTLLIEDIGCLPILDNQYQLTGILTRSDVLKALAAV